MKVTKVGPSTQPNAYVYHIKLEFTDSNKKIWTLDKDLDVYAMWFDCNRQTNPVTDMDPVAFTLESGNHNTQGEAIDEVTGDPSSTTRKIIYNGQLIIERNGKIYNALGSEIK